MHVFSRALGTLRFTRLRIESSIAQDFAFETSTCGWQAIVLRMLFTRRGRGSKADPRRHACLALTPQKKYTTLAHRKLCTHNVMRRRRIHVCEASPCNRHARGAYGITDEQMRTDRCGQSLDGADICVAADVAIDPNAVDVCA